VPAVLAGWWSVRVLVVFLQICFVHMLVRVAGAVVAVLVLMFHMLVVVLNMGVYVSHIAVLVLVAVGCLGHLRSVLRNVH
jgi:hypothetical protein